MATTVTRATTDPTDRSIPPERMIRNRPRPATACALFSWRRPLRLTGSKNLENCPRQASRAMNRSISASSPRADPDGRHRDGLSSGRPVSPVMSRPLGELRRLDRALLLQFGIEPLAGGRRVDVLLRQEVLA